MKEKLLENISIYLKKEQLPNNADVAQILRTNFQNEDDMRSFLKSTTKSIPGTP